MPTTMRHLLGILPKWGVPESVFSLPLPVFQCPGGSVHIAPHCQWLQTQARQPRMLALRDMDPTKKWQMCQCLESTAPSVPQVVTGYRIDLSVLDMVCEAILDVSPEASLSQRSQDLHKALFALAHLSSLRSSSSLSGEEFDVFVDSLIQGLHERAKLLHDDLVENLPAWCAAHGVNPQCLRSGPWSLVGFDQVNLKRLPDDDLDLVFGTLLPREDYHRSSAAVDLAARVPTALATVLMRQFPLKCGRPGNIVPSTKEDTPAVLENLRTLWDPSAESSLGSFANAVAAARSL